MYVVQHADINSFSVLDGNPEILDGQLMYLDRDGEALFGSDLHSVRSPTQLSDQTKTSRSVELLYSLLIMLSALRRLLLYRPRHKD